MAEASLHEPKTKSSWSVQNRFLDVTENSRGARSGRIAFSIDEDLIDDVDDAIRKQDIRLHDLCSGVTGGDELPRAVDLDLERFPCCGCEVGICKLGRVIRRSVDKL